MIPKATWVLRKDYISVVAVREFESDMQDFEKILQFKFLLECL